MEQLSQFVPNILTGMNSNQDSSDEEKFTRYCDNCGDPCEKTVGNYIYHVDCKCEKMARLNAKINKLKKLSLLGERYKDVIFESSKTGANPQFDKVFNRCEKYCENFKTCLENGHGMYIFGDVGVGKTHLTACIANELLKNCVPVLFTSLFEISKAVKSTFNRTSSNTEQDLINQFASIEFLFFDDLGTEILTKNETDTWLQCLLFDLINRRYNARKPTIFSSNYSINDLVSLRGLLDKTASRIAEMSQSAVMKITGESQRGKFTEKLPF